MYKSLSVLTVISVLLFAITTLAADKVVVIPIGSNSGNCLDSPSPRKDKQGNWVLACSVKVQNIPFIEDCQNLYPIKDPDGKWTLACGNKIVFVSSVPYSGNLGGLTGADAKCNTLAQDAGLFGTFKAWLSDASESPSTRFNTSDDFVYQKPDGTIIANSWSDLIDGIDSKIDLDEYSAIKDVFVWTNSDFDGTNFTSGSNHHCEGWEYDNTYTGAMGMTNPTQIMFWSNTLTSRLCSESHHIYCFQQ